MNNRPKKIRRNAPLKLQASDKILIRAILEIGEDGDTAAVFSKLKNLSLPARLALSAASPETIRQTALDVLPLVDKVTAKAAMLASPEKKAKAINICREVKAYLSRRIAA